MSLNAICDKCNQEIYAILTPIVTGALVDSSAFASLWPEEYGSPVSGTRMDCPKCGGYFPIGDGEQALRIMTTEGIKP